MSPNFPENKIIAEVLDGNTRAFASIMEAYAHKVFALVAGMTGNAEDAADITQDIFTKVFTSLSSFKVQSSFSTWLFRISYNMALSHLRTSGRVPLQSADDNQWNSISENAAEDVDEEDITADMLYKALDMLTSDERTLITLFYLEGKSLAEIAFIMSVSETNAKTRLFRIRNKLRKIISDGIK
ncbi:MAG: RNA polymerase sigma factor [Muribaculaceae bacterium]|nr:RNA polymerase sigma factor [Muribaculaceae bacterium]